MAKKITKKQLFDWCLEQAILRYRGTLEQWKIDKLNETEFPWSYYEDELDKLGYAWHIENPNGVRYKGIKDTNG